MILGIVGGGVSYLYNRLQKNRELVLSLISQTSNVHTDFLALRYKYNAFFDDSGKPIRSGLQPDDIEKIKWKYYEEVCILLSRFQSLKPLLNKFLPKNNTDISMIDSYYQTFRRNVRSNQPIFQTEDGKTGEGLKALKTLHYRLVRTLADKT